MMVSKFDIEGPLLIKNIKHGDERGFFTERFREDSMVDLGISVKFCQENFSRSAYGVLRGLHYQFDRPQSKLVTCTRGQIFDVIVDIRLGSPTFGRHLGVRLSGDEPSWLWVPFGFAHGFYVESLEGADILYKVDSYYNPKGEGGILWCDPDLNIEWPIKGLAGETIVVSEKDKVLPKIATITPL